jgi:hypothetical protein
MSGAFLTNLLVALDAALFNREPSVTAEAMKAPVSFFNLGSITEDPRLTFDKVHSQNGLQSMR